MNTPPTIKRFKPPNISISEMRTGTWALALEDDAYKIALARIITDFEHLEYTMPNVLTALLHTPWSDAAGYVYRSLRSPKIRSDLMWHLLEVAPHNMRAPPFLDSILTEYGKIRTLRNEYAHGLWSTNLDTKQTYLARFPEHGDWMPGESKPEPIEALLALAERIGALKVRIWQEVAPLLSELAQQQIEHAQQVATRRAEKLRRRAAKAPPPPPQSSEE